MKIGRGWFDGLAARFSLLLLATLLGANAIAALLLAHEGSQLDRAVRMEGDRGRLIALVSAIEESDSGTGSTVVANSSTGFTRFTLDPKPIIPPDRPSNTDMLWDLEGDLPGHAIRAVDMTPTPDHGSGRQALMMISVQIERGYYAGTWLNSLVYPLPPGIAWQWKAGFFAPLVASLVGTLLVGLMFVRWMTAPLQTLAAAAQAAGRGDHDLQVAETGPREVRDVAIAFNDMQRRISAFDAERDRLVATIGHDLRTPITGLMMRTELYDPDENREEMLRILREMTVMTDELFEYTRMRRMTEPLEPTDLTALLRRACAARGIAMPPMPDVVLPVRAVAMTRAFDNLLGNALRYAGNARAAIAVTATEARITIEDDGPGIPEADLGAVIEPFVRVESSRSLETGGLGLGLSIVKDVVAQHGGTLTLDNRPAGGLRVTLTLPRLSERLPTEYPDRAAARTRPSAAVRRDPSPSPLL